MTNLSVVPYNPSHLDQIVVKEIQRGEMPNLICTDAVTVMCQGAPIAILGAFMFIPGVMHVWSLMSEDVRQRTS